MDVTIGSKPAPLEHTLVEESLRDRRRDRRWRIIASACCSPRFSARSR